MVPREHGINFRLTFPSQKRKLPTMHDKTSTINFGCHSFGAEADVVQGIQGVSRREPGTPFSFLERAGS
jgi:hypothetical protein